MAKSTDWGLTDAGFRRPTGEPDGALPPGDIPAHIRMDAEPAVFNA